PPSSSTSRYSSGPASQPSYPSSSCSFWLEKGRNGVKISFSVSTTRSATKRIVAARSRSSLITAQGASWSTYWFPRLESRIASTIAARNRACSMSSPTQSKPSATASSTLRSVSLSSPGTGTSPKLRYALVNVRLTTFPQLARSSSLFLLRSSAQEQPLACVAGPAAVKK